MFPPVKLTTWSKMERASRIPPSAFCCDDSQGSGSAFDMFQFGNVLQMVDSVFDADAVEVINLATAQNSRQYLMLFRCGKDEDGMMRRFFQCFRKVN